MGCSSSDITEPSTPLKDIPDTVKLRIIHFNDIYNIQEDDGKGGAARFVTALEHYRGGFDHHITCFSGDMIAPSLLSSVFEGEQHVKPFNAMKVDAAVIGNHELDFGVNQLTKIIDQISAPQQQCKWVMSNLRVKGSKPDLAGMAQTAVIDKGPLRIGLIGIAEEEWFVGYDDLEVDVVFHNEVKMATELAKRLRQKQGCNFVIVMTHMWTKNDVELATKTPGIDIVLAGHDHVRLVQSCKNDANPTKDIPLVKSGYDFHDLCTIDVTFGVDKEKMNAAKTKAAESTEAEKPEVMYSEPDAMMYEITQINVDDKKFEPHAETDETAKSIMADLNARMNKDIGHTAVTLEGRKEEIRVQETEFGNFVADLIRTQQSTEIGIVNVGGFRLNDVIPVGNFTHLTMQEMFPYPDNLIVIKVPAAILKEALEVSVALYPEAEGDWLAVSGLKFAFDPSKPANERIDPASIILASSGKPIDMNAEYTITANSFIGKGGGGFNCFEKEEVKMIVDPENTVSVLDMILQFCKRTSKDYTVLEKNKARLEKRLGIFNTSSKKPDDVSPDGKFIMIRPQVEGRITIIGKE